MRVIGGWKCDMNGDAAGLGIKRFGGEAVRECSRI